MGARTVVPGMLQQAVGQDSTKHSCACPDLIIELAHTAGWGVGAQHAKGWPVAADHCAASHR